MLLDTCILIDVLRGKSPAVSWLSAVQTPVSISVLTIMEIESGAKPDEAAPIAALFGELDTIDLNSQVARQGGVFMRNFRKSHHLDPVDALIAATATIHGLPLATLNLKHFPMFPGLERPY